MGEIPAAALLFLVTACGLTSSSPWGQRSTCGEEHRASAVPCCAEQAPGVDCRAWCGSFCSWVQSGGGLLAGVDFL